MQKLVISLYPSNFSAFCWIFEVTKFIYTFPIIFYLNHTFSIFFSHRTVRPAKELKFNDVPNGLAAFSKASEFSMEKPTAVIFADFHRVFMGKS